MQPFTTPLIFKAVFQHKPERVMAPCEITEDYYAILEVTQTATNEIIRKSYLRLAVALHPDRNPDKPGATACFQSLLSAYQTISDPDKRQAYDRLWVGIKHRQSTQREATKRQAEAAEAERKRAAGESLNRQREQALSQERLRSLEKLRNIYDSEIFELNRVVRKLTADIKFLQDQDDEVLRKEKEKNSWWAYFTSSKAKESEEQKQQRETDRLQRLASKSIKGNELKQKEARLQSLKSSLQDVNSKIAAEKKKNEAETRAQAAKRQEQLRQEQEAKRRLEAQQERERQAAHARAQREEAARAAQKAREAREAQEAKQARELHEAQERAERVRAARRAEAAREAEAARRTTAAAFKTPYRASTSRSKSTCQHNAFWPKVEGSQLCSNCHAMQRRFAFKCPGCKMIACANCRQILKGQRGRSNQYSGRGFGFGGDDGLDFEDYNYDYD